MGFHVLTRISISDNLEKEFISCIYSAPFNKLQTDRPAPDIAQDRTAFSAAICGFMRLRDMVCFVAFYL